MANFIGALIARGAMKIRFAVLIGMAIVRGPAGFIADNARFAMRGARWGIYVPEEGFSSAELILARQYRQGYFGGDSLGFGVYVTDEETECENRCCVGAREIITDDQSLAIQMLRQGFEMPSEEYLRRMFWPLEFALDVHLVGMTAIFDEDFFCCGDCGPMESNKDSFRRDLDGGYRARVFGVCAPVGLLGRRYARCRVVAAAAYMATSMELFSGDDDDGEGAYGWGMKAPARKYWLIPGMMALALRLWLTFPAGVVMEDAPPVDAGAGADDA